MPVLPPKPPLGGITCAASPARNTRPSRNRSATSAVARHRETLSMRTSRSGTPAPVRTWPMRVASLMSAAALAAASGSAAGSPTVLMTRKPGGLGPVHAEEPADRRVLHVEDADRQVGQPARQVGGEVDRDRVREHRPPGPADAQQLAHARMRAVGADRDIGRAARARRRSPRGARSSRRRRRPATRPTTSCCRSISAPPCRARS